MIGAARWTWITLRRPAILVPGVAAVVAFGIAVTVATFYTAGRPGGSRLGAEPLYLQDMGAAGIPADLVGRTLMITGAVALAVAAAHVGGAFTSGLVRTVFVRQPSRLRWLVGTWWALCGFTAALTVIGSVTVLLTAAIAATASGIDISAWLSASSLAAAGVRTIGVAVALIGFTTAGVLLAVIVRSAVVAIGIGLAYGLFEGLFAATLGEAGRYLPAQTLAVVSRGLADPGFVPALVVGAVLIAGCLAAAALILSRRDVLD